MKVDLELAREVLASQPFNRFIGAELNKFSELGVEIVLGVRDELRQQNGFVHGGVLCYLADNALTFAGGACLQGQIVTSELKINYLRPAIGDKIVARASVLSSGRTQAVVRCDIFVISKDTERLCAAAQGTIVAQPVVTQVPARPDLS